MKHGEPAGRVEQPLVVARLPDDRGFGVPTFLRRHGAGIDPGGDGVASFGQTVEDVAPWKLDVGRATVSASEDLLVALDKAFGQASRFEFEAKQYRAGTQMDFDRQRLDEFRERALDGITKAERMMREELAEL